MGLNLSNCLIAKELELCASDVQEMTQKLREGVESKRPEIVLEGEVKFDEVYVVAGHKGNPENVKKERSYRDDYKSDSKKKEHLSNTLLVYNNH